MSKAGVLPGFGTGETSRGTLPLFLAGWLMLGVGAVFLGQFYNVSTRQTTVYGSAESALNLVSVSSSPNVSVAYETEKPPDKRELGRSTWTTFHTMAANYPNDPTDADKEHAQWYIESIAKLYPCTLCREHFERYISIRPPE